MPDFESPKFLIGQTREQLIELDRILIPYFSHHLLIAENEPRTNRKIIKQVFTGPIPGRVRHIAASGIADMRHALDQATCSAFEIVTGKSAPNTLYFPIASSPADLASRLTRALPPSLHAVFQSFQSYGPSPSYEGGSTILAALSKAAQRKHRVTCSVHASVGSWSFRELHLSAHTEFPIFEWIAEKGELIIAKTPGHVGGLDMNFNYQVVYQNAGPIDGEPISPVLGTFADTVERIVLSIEAEVDRIVG
ncbi:hypothetical protein AB7Z32_23675 [Bradyrhizobium sp. 482_C4_N1_1]|uniref:hypothetical protein n=1 Tax=unclassified Bradyrhizobium TaxID=2631580 RepID=UPI003F8CE1FA